MIALACLLALQVIPDDRLADWKLAGVPGGIPARTRLIDVTKPPFNADASGKSDAQPAIAEAIAKAGDQDVVYLPAGTYTLGRGIGVGVKSRITIRGAGPDKTILRGSISVGAGGADWWYENRLKVPVTGVRGATVLQAADTSALEIGQFCQLSRKNDTALPVVTPGNWDYLQRQVSRIVAKTPTSVTISPALLFDLPASAAPRLAPAGRSPAFVGIEDLAVDGRGLSLQTGVNITAAYGCWLRNVAVRSITNYHVSISDSLQCDIRHCTISTRQGTGSNGAAILFGTSSFCRVEDNILAEQFPHLEVNGAAGNVFAYNYCHDSVIQGVVGCSINSNHGPHSCFNLYEGNVSPKFQADGYHGSSSHDTVFRNRLHGTSDKTDQFWICVNLNRFTRKYSLLGNVLGAPGHPWLYDNMENGYGYDQHLIYSFGMPNMGNGGFAGKAQPSQGKPWKDWALMLEGPRGKGPGPGGFQELDLDVRATTILKGNFNYKDNGVPEAEALGRETLPKSLYLKAKPDWFGELAWPPFGPDTSFEKNQIPAQARFERKAP